MSINLADYSRTAAQRGWGAGWPSCGGAKAAGTAVVTVDRSGTRISVHKRIARLVDLLVDATEARGYLLKPGQCGGYVCRPIAGTSTASNHSFGLAVDLNWVDNPMRSPLTTDIPAWMVQMWNRFGFAWGGNYTGQVKDCLSGDTLIVTEDGPQAIRELSGQTVSLLSTVEDPRKRGNVTAQWVKAPVESYGFRPIHEVTLTRRNARQVVRCTPGHRWPLRNIRGQVRFVPTDQLADALRQGDTVPAMRYPDVEVYLDREAIAQGIVWGDGSVYNNHGKRIPQARVQLCGEKVELTDFLVDFAGYWTDAKDGPNAWRLPAHLKSLPDTETASLEVLAGFFAGWFACDGFVEPGGRVPPSLSSSDLSAVAWIKQVAPRLGLTITNISVQPAGRSGFNSTKPNHSICFRRVPEWLLLRTKHFDRQPERGWFNWRVVSVRDTGLIEEVFCPTVADRHVVALASPSVPILTGQSMHFEFMGTPVQADEMTALAMRELPGSVPQPPAVLAPGATGPRVQALQRVLNAWYSWLHLVEDGVYGPATEAGVREFQRRAGLPQDGIAGPLVLARLGLA